LNDKEQVGRWAIITLHEHLPSRTEQIVRARAWGLPSIWRGSLDESSIIQDDVRDLPRTTKWAGSDRFPKRDEWLARMRGATDIRPQVAFFATPLCVGFGIAHAQQTMQDFGELGIDVYVHSLDAIYRLGDELTELLEGVSNEANAAYQRAFHRRAEEVEIAAKKEARRLRRLAKNL
jgi:hypothetical protein